MNLSTLLAIIRRKTAQNPTVHPAAVLVRDVELADYLKTRQRMAASAG